MAYARQRPRIPPTGQVTIRLTTAQRNRMLESPAIPPALGHLLHRTPVREGKLMVRVTRVELDTLIRGVAATAVADSKVEREVNALLRYLETQADRFAEPRTD